MFPNTTKQQSAIHNFAIRGLRNSKKITYSLKMSDSLIRTSVYDTSLSRLYKEAVRLEVPVRFVLIRPGPDLKELAATEFDLDSYPNATFMTIFAFIRDLLLQDNDISLNDIWNIVSKFDYNPLELVPIWLHAVPEFQTDNAALLEQIRVFMKNLGEPFESRSMTEIIDYYRSRWLPNYELEYARDLKTLQGYVQAQQEISGIKPVSHGNLDIETTVVTYDYQVAEGVNPLPDIFNSAISSYLVPFIQYNIKPIKGNTDQIKRFYKIYKGKSIDARPAYNNIVLLSDQASRGETIYLNVWQGTDYYDTYLGRETEEAEEEARTGTKGGFGKVSIILIQEPQNTIVRVRFKTPKTEYVDETAMMRRIHAHVPGLPIPGAEATLPDILTGQPDSFQESQISGSFSIYNINLIEVIFFDLVMNDPLFSSYLYLEESGKSFAEKTRLTIHYRGAASDVKSNQEEGQRKSSVTANLAEQILKSGDEYYIGDQRYISDRDLQIVNVKITRASSEKTANQFLDILTRLFRRYTDQGKAIWDRYTRYVPEYQYVVAQKQQAQVAESQTQPRGTRAGGTIVKQLQDIASDIFVVGWARDCQPVARQPQPISPEEIPYWENRLVQNANGVREKRQILSFPKDNPRMLLVCPNDQYPYAGVRVNKRDNAAEYPFLPCCGKQNSMVNPNSKLNKYFRGEQPTAKKVPSAHLMTTEKLLTPGRFGEIPTIVSSFLKRYNQYGSGDILRYGVPESPNSLIHCLAIATENYDYLNAEDKEEWVSQFRTNLFNAEFQSRQMDGTITETLHPEALRQELYDMTNEDILKRATDIQDFFDPLLYYRALELIFGCNIYVFAYKDQEQRSGKKISLLQLPRHKYFHVEPPPSVTFPAILILRYKGSESSALSYPQCELIVDRQPDQTVMQFGEEMNELLYPALTFVGRTISWQIHETGAQVPIMIARLNVYSVLNYNLLFGDIPIIGQIIDNAGKARMFALAPEYDEERNGFTDLRIFVNVLPTAPLNVAEFSPTEIGTQLPPYQKTIELFGEPISATVSIDHRYLTGLWFPFGDIQFGFYCPCEAVLWEPVLEIYPNLNTTSEMSALTINIPRQVQFELSPVQKIRQLRRSAKFINQIVKYLYLLSGMPEDTYTFLSEIGILISEPRPDSAQLYDPTQIPRVLPRAHSGQDPVQNVLMQMQRISPSMFYQNRLLIYDQQMLDGLKYQLDYFRKEIEGIPISATQLRQLNDYYDEKLDISFNPASEYLLGSLKEFDIWLNTNVTSGSIIQRPIQNLKNNIQTKLTPNAFSYQEPYIYQRSDNKTTDSSLNPSADRFYLIQNVAGGDFRRAVQVAYTWFNERRNTGFTTESYAGPEPARAMTGQPLAIQGPVTVEGTEMNTTIVPNAVGDQALVVQSSNTPVLGTTSSGMTTLPMRPGPIVAIQPNPIVDDPVLPAHIIYRISPGGGVIIEQNVGQVDLSTQRPLALEILNYGNNIYAAMLPIL